VRVDIHLLESAAIGQLTHSEFRAWLALLAYVARWRGECDPVDGTFPRDWHRYAFYATPGRRKLGRVTAAHVARFLELGLLYELEDADGKRYLGVRDWRELRPLEWTGAIRQARWRERHGLYGRRARRRADPLPADADLLRASLRDEIPGVDNKIDTSLGRLRPKGTQQ
jgi:hypothetical protein